MRENSRCTCADPVKSGVEGFAEWMERSCYFGKLSGRHERMEGRGYPFVGACHDLATPPSLINEVPAISPMAGRENT